MERTVGKAVSPGRRRPASAFGGRACVIRDTGNEVYYLAINDRSQPVAEFAITASLRVRPCNPSRRTAFRKSPGRLEWPECGRDPAFGFMQFEPATSSSPHPLVMLKQTKEAEDKSDALAEDVALSLTGDVSAE